MFNSSIMLRSYSSVVSITEAMGCLQCATAPSEGVRRSARASGHLLRGIAGLREHNGEVVGDARRCQRSSTARPMIG